MYQFIYFQGFWRFLLQKNLTREWLKGVHYALFGLGDSSYQKYNVMCGFRLFVFNILSLQ